MFTEKTNLYDMKDCPSSAAGGDGNETFPNCREINVVKKISPCFKMLYYVTADKFFNLVARYLSCIYCVYGLNIETD